MGSRSNDDKCTFNKARLIKILAAALEKAPTAPLPKTQSIPMLLWESAKELKVSVAT